MTVHLDIDVKESYLLVVDVDVLFLDPVVRCDRLSPFPVYFSCPFVGTLLFFGFIVKFICFPKVSQASFILQLASSNFRVDGSGPHSFPSLVGIYPLQRADRFP